MLALASLAISFLPFRFIARTASCGGRGGMILPNKTVSILQHVRWAVPACARRLPWRAVCFQQGLAAHWMLRRRGLPSVLYYGAGTDPGVCQSKRIAAHVWVRCGDFDVCGSDMAPRFAVLAAFPRVNG